MHIYMYTYIYIERERERERQTLRSPQDKEFAHSRDHGCRPFRTPAGPSGIATEGRDYSGVSYGSLVWAANFFKGI